MLSPKGNEIMVAYHLLFIAFCFVLRAYCLLPYAFCLLSWQRSSPGDHRCVIHDPGLGLCAASGLPSTAYQWGSFIVLKTCSVVLLCAL